MVARLGYTIVYVDDVRAAAAFYAHVFGFTPLEVEVSPGWAMLDAGGPILGFSSHELMSRFYPSGYRPVDPEDTPPGFELDIVVDGLDELHALVDRAVGAGARLVEAPRIADDGATVVFLRDPHGVIVEIQTPYQSPAAAGAADKNLHRQTTS
jgi:lactoylglutathione lyase